jgi:5'-nucleotidase
MPDSRGGFHFDLCARLVSILGRHLLQSPLPPGLTLNINIPAPPLKGIRLAGLGQKRYHPEIIVKRDPRDRDYYWIGTGTPKAVGAADSDVKLIQQGFVTVTPLHRDMTAYEWMGTGELSEVMEEMAHDLAAKTV